MPYAAQTISAILISLAANDFIPWGQILVWNLSKQVYHPIPQCFAGIWLPYLNDITPQ